MTNRSLVLRGVAAPIAIAVVYGVAYILSDNPTSARYKVMALSAIALIPVFAGLLLWLGRKSDQLASDRTNRILRTLIPKRLLRPENSDGDRSTLGRKDDTNKSHDKT